MRNLLRALVLAPLTLAACQQQPADDLSIGTTSVMVLADGRVQTTVQVVCLDDCSAEASHCAQVSWPLATGDDPPMDVDETCAATAPTPSAPEMLVVTSSKPIPVPSTGTRGTLRLLDAAGEPIPQDVSDEGAALTDPTASVSIPAP